MARMAQETEKNKRIEFAVNVPGERSSLAPVAGPLLIVHKYNPLVSCLFSTSGIVQYGGSGRPACGHRLLRAPTRGVMVPTIDPYRRSNGSDRQACASRHLHL